MLFTTNLFANKIGIKTVSITNYNSAHEISGGNFILYDNATLEIESKMSVTNGKGKYKVNVALTGLDKKGNKYSSSFDADFIGGETNCKGKIDIKASKDNPVFISKVIISATDEKGNTTSETESFAISETKTSFAILLNGIAKPINKGQCKYGQCWCFAGTNGSLGKIIEFDSIKVKQTLLQNKEKNNTTLDIALEINNSQQSENMPTIAQLVAWGEISSYITANIIDSKGKKENITIPCDIVAEKGICLYTGQIVVSGNGTLQIEAAVVHFKPANGAYFGMSSTSLFLRYAKGYEKPTSNNFTWTETWTADQTKDACSIPELNNVFMNETKTDTYIEYVIGFNDEVNEAFDLIAKYSMKGKKGGPANAWCTEEVKSAGSSKLISNLITPTKDKNGKWIFVYKSTISDSKNPPVLVEFQIAVINICGDTLKFVSTYKQKLGERKPWDYKIGMSALASDNPVFQGNNNVFNNTLALRFSNSGTIIVDGDLLITDNAKFTIGGSLGNVNNSNFKPLSNNYGVLRGRWDGTYSIGKSPGTWSSSTQMFEYTYQFNASKEKPITLTDYTFTFVDDKKDTIIYEHNGKLATSLDGKEIIVLLKKSEKIKYYNPCNTKYKLKNIEYSVDVFQGSHAFQFWVKFENNSDIPNSTAMIVEIKDCAGASQYISITLKYDEKTGIYYGYQTLKEVNKCALELVYGEIAAYNECKDKTVWSIDFTKAKGNGSGTKNASTQTSTRPQLL